MSTDLRTVDIDATLDDVLGLMRKHVYSCLIVVNNNIPVGIITERDLVKVLSDLLWSNQQRLSNPHQLSKPQRLLYVTDLMSAPPVCIDESDTLYDALVVTQSHGIRHLPVVNEANHLVGLVTQTNIAQAHFTAVERHREVIEQEIRDRTQEVVDANEKLKELALQDSLLGIGNRRAMEVDIHFTHANSKRHRREYTCALLDVDYFKRYNDNYGHQAGDDALRQVANSIKSSIRCSDRLYRYGGEEFLVLMPETNLFAATQAISRVLKNIELLELPHEKSALNHITISGGIGSVVNNESWETVVREADSFLYEAKELGRNQFCCRVDAATPPFRNSARHSLRH